MSHPQPPQPPSTPKADPNPAEPKKPGWWARKLQIIGERIGTAKFDQ